ncbi:hypothetical protein BD779DRAFT_1673862 [Infundibulicybe gibba]|nr:hypothetical protein BD779DRAFT_1673862 [Infundibulicybe gibba]
MSLIFKIAKPIASGLWNITKPYFLVTVIGGEEPICVTTLKADIALHGGLIPFILHLILVSLGLSKKRKMPAQAIYYGVVVTRHPRSRLAEKSSSTPRKSTQATEFPTPSMSALVPRPQYRVRKLMVLATGHFKTPIAPAPIDIVAEFSIVNSILDTLNKAVWFPYPAVFSGLFMEQVAPFVSSRQTLSPATATILALKACRYFRVTAVSQPLDVLGSLSDDCLAQMANEESPTDLDLELTSEIESYASADECLPSIQACSRVFKSLVPCGFIGAISGDVSMDTTLVEKASFSGLLLKSPRSPRQHNYAIPHAPLVHDMLTGCPPSLVPSSEFLPSVTFKEAGSRFCTEKALISTLARHQLTVHSLNPKAAIFVPSARTKEAANVSSKPPQKLVPSSHTPTTFIQPSGKPPASPSPKKILAGTHHANQLNPLKNISMKAKPQYTTPPSINTRRVTIEGLVATFGRLPRTSFDTPTKKAIVGADRAPGSSSSDGPATQKSSPRTPTPYRTMKTTTSPKQRAPTCSACKSRPSTSTTTPTPAR